MDIIKAHELTKQYKDVNALDNFSISIPKNKIIGLIGKNGAGKTTFLKTCAGRIRQTSGEIKIFDDKVFDNLNVLSKLVFVDEESQYNSGYKVKEIIEMANLYYESWDGEFADKLIKHFKLNTNKRYKKLSRGMKTQVNIIVGICCRMPLTILDEPTLGLDAAFRKDFYHILLTDFINHPRTIIISSHLLNEIEMLLEEIILIDDGKLLMHTSMEDFSNYSMMLSGNTTYLESFTEGKEVININSFVNTSEYIIKNNLSKKEITELKNNDISIKSVSPQDLFIFLTSKGVLFDEF